MTDQQLLTQFADRQDESAFAELVRRHLNWVHSAALRQVGDPHTADDVAQAVFIALASKAAKIPRTSPLSPWLFKATRYACTHALRAASRRRFHENEAAAMTVEQSPEPGDLQWTELAPHLDEQMGHLRASDRQAILLRYFEGRGFTDIGKQLGITEEAARKRTDRAVERLRHLLNQKIPTGAVAGLATLLGAYAVQPADAALLAKIIPGACAGLTNASGAASNLAQSIIHMTKMAALKAMASILLLAALIVTGGGFHYRHQSHLRATGSPSGLDVITAGAPLATTTAAKSETQMAIDAMKANDQALKQVHVVFRLTVATDLEPNEQPNQPRDADGLTEIQSRFFEGDIAPNGYYRLQCGESGDNPKWDGAKLTNWPDALEIDVSDGHDILVYHDGNQNHAAFMGSVAAHGQSQLEDVVQHTQMINDWLSNPNHVESYEKLVLVATPPEAQHRQKFEESVGPATVVGLTCDPDKGFLAEYRTFKVDGELFRDSRNSDAFEVVPNVWRPRNTVDREFLTRRFILSVQKDAKDPKDHMMHRSTLEIYEAIPGNLDETLFNPTAPDDANWVYKVNADGSNTALVKPPGPHHRRAH